MISIQEPLMYGSKMNLGFIPMEGVTRLSVLTTHFKANECGRCKLESDHHYVSHYLSLPELVINDSFHPSLCTRPISTPKIYTSAYHWNGNSITHYLVLWIDTGGLNT